MPNLPHSHKRTQRTYLLFNHPGGGVGVSWTSPRFSAYKTVLLAKAKIKQKGKVPLGEMACSIQKGKVPLGEMACSIQSSTRGNGLPDHPRTRGAGVDRTRRRTRARASLPHPRMVGESGARLSTASPAYHPQLTAYHSPSGPTYLLINRPGRPTYLFKSIGR